MISKTEFIARMRHLGWCCFQIACGQEYNIRPNQDQLESLIKGTEIGLTHLDATPEENHQTWLDTKISQGWKYGEKKDFKMKTHPDIVPFDELPQIEKNKDIMDVTMLKALSELYDQIFKE